LGKSIRHSKHSFFSTVNKSGLQKHYLAAKISMIEEALEIGQSYYQVDNPHRADFTASRVKEAIEEETRVGAVAEPAPPSSQITMLLDMVKSLQMEVVRLQQQQGSKRIANVRTNPTRLNQSTCWGVAPWVTSSSNVPKRGRLL